MTRNDLIAELACSKARLRHCAERLGAYVKGREVYASRAMMAAGRLLNCDLDAARHRIAMVVRKGSVEAYEAWLGDLGRIAYGDIDRSLVGYVYRARLDRHPHIIKIGFSHDPEERMRSLRYQTGEVHTLLSASIGTIVDEAAAHMEWSRYRVTREWFWAPESARRLIPDFLLSGVDRESADRWTAESEANLKGEGI